MIQVGDEVREMTDEELESYRQLQEEIEANKVAAIAAVEARKEPLRRLGLTNAEIDALLGI
jgi:uncharacterized protein YydD (DUF2326 family)